MSLCHAGDGDISGRPGTRVQVLSGGLRIEKGQDSGAAGGARKVAMSGPRLVKDTSRLSRRNQRCLCECVCGRLGEAVGGQRHENKSWRRCFACY
jgi:hypothetical protein